MTAAQHSDEETCDVVVIGAGMSGLMAATTLADKVDVVVIEAGSRPGGRVETVRKGNSWTRAGPSPAVAVVKDRGEGCTGPAERTAVAAARVWRHPRPDCV
ncbi:FAD-dependent oxidoreductase [Streptomyces sp. NPDC057494]|uniref:FAD-dependent oxidoreductase n=1 Tax=Streptomyces sp. NPDC057494 TaxID=3346148 RepID=UPI00368900E5